MHCGEALQVVSNLPLETGECVVLKRAVSLLGHLYKQQWMSECYNLRSKAIMTTIFLHGSGHKAKSWDASISYMESKQEILCPDLAFILKGKEATFANLYDSFVEYCNLVDGSINLCGLSLGGILALNYTLDFPEKVKALVLIGAPHKIPKLMFPFKISFFAFCQNRFLKILHLIKKILSFLETP